MSRFLLSLPFLFLLTATGCQGGYEEDAYAWEEEEEYPYVDPRFGDAKRQHRMLKSQNRREDVMEKKQKRLDKKKRRYLRQSGRA